MAGLSARGGTRSRRELAAVLLAGLAGAGLVLLASRQQLARVVVRAPRPLPATVTAVSAQDLRPAIGALAVAALASLAAVLATRGFLRRLTGLVTIALAAGIALLGAGTVTPAAVRAAAGRAGASPASGAAGTAAAVTAGSGQGAAAGSLGGFPSHVLLEGSGWRVLTVAGVMLILAAGVVVLARAGLPAMSGRYDRPRTTRAGLTGRARTRPAGESMWESLSAGADPTVWPE